MIDDRQHQLVGYFTDASQDVPAYDPGTDAPCIVCMKPIAADQMRTVSVALYSGRKRSLFYRAHRSCEEESGALIESSIIDREAQHHG